MIDQTRLFLLVLASVLVPGMTPDGLIHLVFPSHGVPSARDRNAIAPLAFNIGLRTPHLNRHIALCTRSIQTPETAA